MIEIKDKDVITELKSLFFSFYGVADINVTPIPMSGSDRRYFRMSSEKDVCIGTFSPDSKEGKCFVDLTKDFKCMNKNVPEVFIASADYRYYLQEDLGDISLFSVLGSNDTCRLIKETLKRLVSLQKTPVEAWSSDCVSKPFSARQVMWDLNYFKYEYLKPQNVAYDEDLLEDDFELLARRLLSIPEDFCGFMMRDCQSRNVMLTSDGPTFIDYQGGRYGPVLYDPVSFLWQARAGFSSDFREEMLDFYVDLFCGGDDEKKGQMLSALPDVILFRTLQVLGAYGFRGLVQHKAHFIMSIPGALKNLKDILDAGFLNLYQELKSVAETLVDGISDEVSDSLGRLTVEIFSFSYKKGYPSDLSGNGGGFMFDCRAMHNPGRYKEYKTLTGRDRVVVDFLERRGEVQPFLQNAWAMTDASVERYISRGFSNLQIGFGCTGGQHRSVYCAWRTAQHISSLFPEVRIKLIHREHPEDKLGKNNTF